ncbi:hypothetical protein [Sporomusa termitida]|uniref:Uncharacterized protein n=1 Tax=Sporomusa termitida TaxID=2377 RepID=A0A517DQI5_9FIRM|nr:hypothetical protein [Sporomusa termitida]QDR79622.1 hypothetical protein SPTER_09000 [Sporomusa termitida]
MVAYDFGVGQFLFGSMGQLYPGGDTVVNYAKVAEIMLDALLTIFPEADITSKDISQMYYGGKKLIYFDEAIPMINIDSLISNMSLYLYDRYGKKHYKDKIYNFLIVQDLH